MKEVWPTNSPSELTACKIAFLEVPEVFFYFFKIPLCICSIASLKMDFLCFFQNS